MMSYIHEFSQVHEEPQVQLLPEERRTVGILEAHRHIRQRYSQRECACFRGVDWYVHIFLGSTYRSMFGVMFIDESGWCWYIPLHKGLTSVGIVMDQTQLGIRNREMSSSPLVERYRSFIELAPTIRGLIGNGELVAVKSDEDDGPGEGPTIRSASDYSYSAPEYSGPGFRIAGDASGWCHICIQLRFCVLIEAASLHRPLLLFGSPSRVHRRLVRCSLDRCIYSGRLL